jgi:hypothetical protein
MTSYTTGMRAWLGVTVGVVVAMSVCAPGLAQSAQPQSPATRPAPPRGVLPPQPQGATPASPSGPGQSPPVAKPAPAPQPAAPAAVPAGEPVPGAAVLGAPVYPGASFLGSFNAGLGQRYYLFGSDADYMQVITFYRNALKSKGGEIYEVPPIWSFEIGRFREESMAYPPSVVVRDHVSGGGRGYLHVAGTQSHRYPTVIQIVPPAPGDRRNP